MNGERLFLILYKRYFDAILDGSKKIEYRNKTDYWRKRLINRDYKTVVFQNGYATNAPRITCDVVKIEETPLHFEIHLSNVRHGGV